MYFEFFSRPLQQPRFSDQPPGIAYIQPFIKSWTTWPRPKLELEQPARSCLTRPSSMENGWQLAAAKLLKVHVEASDTCICGPVSIEYLIYVPYMCTCLRNLGSLNLCICGPVSIKYLIPVYVCGPVVLQQPGYVI